MKKISLIIICSLLINVCFSSALVFGKTIKTRANSKYIYKVNTSKDYNIIIKPKKTGIIKMVLNMETEEYGYDYDFYGSCWCDVYGASGGLIYSTRLNDEDHTVKKKTLRFIVLKGKKYSIELYGTHYTFDVSWKIKKYDRPVINGKTKIKKGYLRLKWFGLKNTNGYEVQLSSNKKFRKNTFIKTVRGLSTKIRLKDIKHYKKVFVRVRGYRILNGKKLSSKWSKALGFKRKK